jgi:hypothetical protein
VVWVIISSSSSSLELWEESSSSSCGESYHSPLCVFLVFLDFFFFCFLEAAVFLLNGMVLFGARAKILSTRTRCRSPHVLMPARSTSLVLLLVVLVWAALVAEAKGPSTFRPAYATVKSPKDCRPIPTTTLTECTIKSEKCTELYNIPMTFYVDAPACKPAKSSADRLGCQCSDRCNGKWLERMAPLPFGYLAYPL